MEEGKQFQPPLTQSTENRNFFQQAGYKVAQMGHKAAQQLKDAKATMHKEFENLKEKAENRLNQNDNEE